MKVALIYHKEEEEEELWVQGPSVNEVSFRAILLCLFLVLSNGRLRAP
jgi:hypothetical protein